jgi:hypothetical protein
MITAARLRRLLDYNKKTGIFRWRKSPALSVPAGAVAGTIDNAGYRVIRISGRGYKASRLAILHVTGAWPKREVRHRDGKRHNDAFANLREATRSEVVLNIRASRTRTS